MGVFCFKQFNIVDDYSSMKVGTDGVLLGSWAKTEDAKNILDIGTGCGLIALICAQRNPQAHIIGIDIDPLSIQEAGLNFAHTKFSERLFAYKYALQDYTPSILFDAIVCNPPFFEHNSKTIDNTRKYARQEVHLSLDELIRHGKSLMNERAILSVILPYEKEKVITQLCCTHNLNLKEICVVQGLPSSKPKRLLCAIEKTKQTIHTKETRMVLEAVRGKRSELYQSLTQDLYL